MRFITVAFVSSVLLSGIALAAPVLHASSTTVILPQPTGTDGGAISSASPTIYPSSSAPNDSPLDVDVTLTMSDGSEVKTAVPLPSAIAPLASIVNEAAKSLSSAVAELSRMTGGALSSAGSSQGRPAGNATAHASGNTTNEPSSIKTSTGNSTIQHPEKASNSSSDGAETSSATNGTWAAQLPRTRFCGQPDLKNVTIAGKTMQLSKQRRALLRQKATAAFGRGDSSPSKNGTHELSAMAADALVHKYLASAAARAQVDVVWHVLHSGPEGNLTDGDIQRQISGLNADYAPYGYSFRLINTTRSDDAAWFSGINSDNAIEAQVKGTLRQGDKSTLNLYSADLQNGLLGYATFPWDVSNDLRSDGVVFLYSTVPGGSEEGYNSGKTATHEVGHWLGLLHTFQGGCFGDGDGVDDTPPQATPTSGCPVSKDTCPGGGADLVNNFMDYSSDPCLTSFTTGQSVRMSALSSFYRGLQ